MQIITCTKSGTTYDINDLFLKVKKLKPEFNFLVKDLDTFSFIDNKNLVKTVIKVSDVNFNYMKIRYTKDILSQSLRYCCFDSVLFDSFKDNYFNYKSLPRFYYLRAVTIKKCV